MIPRRVAVVLAAIMALPANAYAHSGENLQPHDLWSAWSLEPAVLVLLSVSLVLFVRGLAAQRSSLGRWPDNAALRSAAFASGWLIVAVSLISPLHALGSVLFSAHMIQHELLMTIAAPLLVLARPYPVCLWGMTPDLRRSVSRFVHKRVVKPFAVLGSPLAAWALHGTAIWIWHAPRLYGATLTNELMHTVQHLSFLGTALLFWWTVLPFGRQKDQGASLFYLFSTAIHTGALGALLTFSTGVWYQSYGTSSVPWGLSPLDDQQLGGMIMWIPGGIAYLLAGLWIAAKMLTVSEARALRAGVAALVIVFIMGCKAQHDANEKIFTNADAAHGRMLIRKYGCQACHVIPGVEGANGLVGPPLSGIAGRVYIAGVLPNSPDAMSAWIQDPQRVDSLTAMPNLGVTPGDAQDIAAYLYTLK